MAFVGRPNVGKSTLFNRVVGERVAIVEDRARTTRDRIYDVGEWNGRRFIVVDTGGLETKPGDAIEERVQEQARLAIDEADVIVFLVDAEAGMTPADQEANELLRTSRTPVIVAANKSDNPKRELEAAEFHAFGWPDIHTISALHGRGVADLLDVIIWSLPPESTEELDAKADREAGRRAGSTRHRCRGGRGGRLRDRRHAGARRDHRPTERRQELVAERLARSGACHRE